MAQMVSGNSAQKRKAPFVDLTPMVDLAFLLIAFFMLTTTLLENNAMVLNMPMDTDDPSTISRDRIMTILIGENNNIYYYNADELDKLKETDYQNDGLRNLLYDNNKRVNALFGNEKGLVCIIKLSENANYKNMIDVLDEMVICDVATYAIQDITEEEIDVLKLKK